MSNKSNNHTSAVILAGGAATRLGGANKALLPIRGKQSIERILGVCTPLFTDIVIACRHPELFDIPGIRFTKDLFADRSSLTGLHAGLCAVKNEKAFVIACDMPFLQPQLVQLLVGESLPKGTHNPAITVPCKASGYYEPLCAIYSTRCIQPIEKQLAAGNLKITDLFSQVELHPIPEERLRLADPTLQSFCGINTPAELARANHDKEAFL